MNSGNGISTSSGNFRTTHKINRRQLMARLVNALLILGLTGFYFVPAQAEQEKDSARQQDVKSAIEVAGLINKGKSDSDVAIILARQFGFDRETALKTGTSDRQIILKLLSGTDAAVKKLDKNQSITHKFDGDKLYRESKFEKAAREYTLAINASKDSAPLFKSRGDSYKNYLAGAAPATSKGPKNAPQIELSKPSREILCNSIYSDYKNAIKANNVTLRDIESKLIILNDNMTNRRTADLVKGEVAPFHYRAAGNIHGMREMDSLYRAQRAAKQTEMGIRKSIGEFRQVCSTEYASIRESLSREKERKRDSKWVPFGKAADSDYFYDKTSIVKNKDIINVKTLMENPAGEQADAVSQLNVNCEKKTAGIIESSTFDELGILIQKKRYDSAMKKVLPGTSEEKLLAEICK
jgi:hypothetical protein